MGKGPIQGLGEHSLTAEKMDSIKFSATGRRLCLSLHYNRANSYLFVNGTEMIKFKAKDSELTSTLMCLGNNSNDFSVTWKKQHYMELFMSFSVDYGVTSVDNILNIHKYLIKKYNIVLNV